MRSKKISTKKQFLSRRRLNHSIASNYVGWWEVVIEKVKATLTLNNLWLLSVRYRNLRFYFDIVYQGYLEARSLLNTLQITKLEHPNQLIGQRLWISILTHKPPLAIFLGIDQYKSIDDPRWPDHFNKNMNDNPMDSLTNIGQTRRRNDRSEEGYHQRR